MSDLRFLSFLGVSKAIVLKNLGVDGRTQILIIKRPCHELLLLKEALTHVPNPMAARRARLQEAS